MLANVLDAATHPKEGGNANDYAYVDDPVNQYDLDGRCGIGNPFKKCGKGHKGRTLRGFVRGVAGIAENGGWWLSPASTAAVIACPACAVGAYLAYAAVGAYVVGAGARAYNREFKKAGVNIGAAALAGGARSGGLLYKLGGKKSLLGKMVGQFWWRGQGKAR